jgi:hypothetical protein
VHYAGIIKSNDLLIDLLWHAVVGTQCEGSWGSKYNVVIGSYSVPVCSKFNVFMLCSCTYWWCVDI